MDSPINLSVSPVQALLALAFQVWLIVFPIILMRKIGRLEALVEAHLGSSDESTEEQENV